MFSVNIIISLFILHINNTNILVIIRYTDQYLHCTMWGRVMVLRKPNVDLWIHGSEKVGNHSFYNNSILQEVMVESLFRDTNFRIHSNRGSNKSYTFINSFDSDFLLVIKNCTFRKQNSTFPDTCKFTSSADIFEFKSALLFSSWAWVFSFSSAAFSNFST